MFLQHPYDHLVWEFFSDLRYVREFLSAVLPAELAEALDWRLLRRIRLDGDWSKNWDRLYPAGLSVPRSFIA